MIDDQSDAGSWEIVLKNTVKNIEFLSEAELHAPFILDDLMRWHDIERDEAKRIWQKEVVRRGAG